MKHNVFLNAFKRGLLYLENKKTWINEINVFPVADKDTGDNLVKTIEDAINMIKDSELRSCKDFFNKIADALFETATGNSGLIFSCFFDGFRKAFEDEENFRSLTLKKGFEFGTHSAYEAVYNPKEGTILTVIRKMGEKINSVDGDIISILEEGIEEGERICNETREILPELKSANVPDAGAIGFLIFWEGFLDELKRNFYEIVTILKSWRIKDEKIFDDLKNFGDSLIINHKEEKIKIHIHTFEPYKIKEIISKYGEVLKFHIQRIFND